MLQPHRSTKRAAGAVRPGPVVAAGSSRPARAVSYLLALAASLVLVSPAARAGEPLELAWSPGLCSGGFAPTPSGELISCEPPTSFLVLWTGRPAELRGPVRWRVCRSFEIPVGLSTALVDLPDPAPGGLVYFVVVGVNAAGLGRTGWYDADGKYNDRPAGELVLECLAGSEVS